MDADTPDTEVLSFRVEGAFKRRLDAAREKWGLNVSLFVRQAVERRLDEMDALQGEGGQ